jgi:phage terminase small subunit
MENDLTPKQRAFVIEYMKDRNATQAALRAGYSQKAAGTVGCNLLKNPVVAKLIADKEEANQVDALVTVDKIIHRLNKIACDEQEKTSDRIRADELLGKHLGMFTERVEMKGQIDTAVTKLDGILKQLDE